MVHSVCFGVEPVFSDLICTWGKQILCFWFDADCVFCICCMHAVILYQYIFFTWGIALSLYEATKGFKSKLEKLSYGVKMQKKLKLYVNILLAWKTLVVKLLKFMNLIETWILINILSSVQFWFLVYIIVIRPFENIKENITEILNEVVFLILLTILIYYNKNNDWSYTIKTVYMLLIITNNILIFTIILCRHFY